MKTYLFGKSSCENTALFRFLLLIQLIRLALNLPENCNYGNTKGYFKQLNLSA